MTSRVMRWPSAMGWEAPSSNVMRESLPLMMQATSVPSGEMAAWSTLRGVGRESRAAATRADRSGLTTSFAAECADFGGFWA